MNKKELEQKRDFFKSKIDSAQQWTELKETETLCREKLRGYGNEARIFYQHENNKIKESINSIKTKLDDHKRNLGQEYAIEGFSAVTKMHSDILFSILTTVATMGGIAFAYLRYSLI